MDWKSNIPGGIDAKGKAFASTTLTDVTKWPGQVLGIRRALGIGSRLTRAGALGPREAVMNIESEAKARWGHAAAWREFRRRAENYGPDELRRIHDEADRIEAGLAEALRRGVEPTSPEATGLAEERRRWIDRWFYPRFRKRHDDRVAGLAEFVRDAIRANQ